MKWLQEEIQTEDVPHLWFNLDTYEDVIFFESQGALTDRIELHFQDKKGIVFIDEIQRKENAGRFLKGIYDTHPGWKFVISGSGSLELKEKITESLAGRKRLFDIRPVGFYEFADFMTGYKYSDRLDEFFKIERQKTERLFREYILFGGFPAVTTESDQEEKKNIIREIYDSYLHRDIGELLKLHHIDAFERLLELLAQQAGQHANYSSLSQSISLSANTVRDYIWYMEHTYVVERCRPFYTNPKKEIIKEPLVYFVDLGLLNYQRSNFNIVYGGNLFGMIFQNFVYNTLLHVLRPEGISLKYWRTQNQAEVDIVIDWPGNPIPVEVKYTEVQKPKISKSYLSFIKKYNPHQGLVICKSGDHTINIEGTQIVFAPYHAIRSATKSIISKL